MMHQSLTLFRAAILSFSGVLFVTDLSSAQQLQSVENHIELCKNDPRFRVGGAALGECLEERRDQVDTEIDKLFEAVQKRFCSAADATDLVDGQKSWIVYRDKLCRTVWRAPGNTASYVNASVCYLQVAEQRLADLTFLDTYARPRCPSFEIIAEASRRTRGLGDVVAIPDSGIRWELTGTFRDHNLIFSRIETGKPIASVDLSRCSFCEGPTDNCDRDGIFVLHDPKMPTRPLIMAVCHIGAHSQHLSLFDPVSFGSKSVLEATGEYMVDWQLRRGVLEVFLDGEPDASHSWPSEVQPSAP